MTLMYVANATMQVHMFMYNASGRTSYTLQTIAPGSQIVLGDFTPEDIEGIILQHSKYGFRSIGEALETRNMRNGSQISEAQIRRLIARKKGTLVEMGEELRKEAAVAASSYIDNTIIGEDNPNLALKQMDVSIEELPPRGGTTEGQTLMSEGLTVVKPKKGK
jgi:hypothetical protein